MDEDLNIKVKIKQFLEESIDINLCDFGLGNDL